MFEYKAISKWCGWWGGWGSESDLSAMINAQAAEGWRLVRSENSIFLWWLLPIYPRRKVLMIFERPAPARTIAAPFTDEAAHAKIEAAAESPRTATEPRSGIPGPFSSRR